MSTFKSINATRSDEADIVDPLYAFSFLQTFVDILQEYFGHLSAETLKDNFDIVYQVRSQRGDWFTYLGMNMMV